MYDINGGIEYHAKNATMNENHACDSSKTLRSLAKKVTPRKYHVERSHVRVSERIQAEVGGLPMLVNVNFFGKELHAKGHGCFGKSKAGLCTMYSIQCHNIRHVAVAAKPDGAMHILGVITIRFRTDFLKMARTPYSRRFNTAGSLRHRGRKA